MGKILTFVEIQNEQPKRSSLEALTRCRSIAASRGDDLEAVCIAPAVDAAAEIIARYGPSRIFTVEHPIFATHINTVLAAALAMVARISDPDVIVFPTSESVKDVLGVLAIRLDAPAIPDVSEFDCVEGGVEAIRPVFAAKFLARTRAEGRPVLVSVRAGSYTAAEAPASASIEAIEFDFDSASLRQTVRSLETAREGNVDLTEACVVVAAGRGVRDEKGKRLIEQLASALNAAIGSTRAVVESGLLPPSAQVGQTGKVVSPDLYIAVGISGAIQHVAGMTGSNVVVAINKDPGAPIFKYATYGIIGDLYEILPQLIDALSKR
jgi:electron transfer flavoprotein alpha subunit